MEALIKALNNFSADGHEFLSCYREHSDMKACHEQIMSVIDSGGRAHSMCMESILVLEQHMIDTCLKIEGTVSRLEAVVQLIM